MGGRRGAGGGRAGPCDKGRPAGTGHPGPGLGVHLRMKQHLAVSGTEEDCEPLRKVELIEQGRVGGEGPEHGSADSRGTYFDPSMGGVSPMAPPEGWGEWGAPSALASGRRKLVTEVVGAPRS